jgi:hypothetical protein
MPKGINISFEQLTLLLYQHAAQLQVANPALKAERALQRAQYLAVRAFDEAFMREGLTRAAEQAGVADTLARLPNAEGGATLALSDEASVDSTSEIGRD